jgi:hypothetical protein
VLRMGGRLLRGRRDSDIRFERGGRWNFYVMSVSALLKTCMRSR